MISADGQTAPCRKTRSQSSFVAQSAVASLSTRSVCHVATRLSARPVGIPTCHRLSAHSLTIPPGQSTLPTTCPVCEHSPVGAEDCKPHKALRTTIKVFLRTEEKKREAIRLKEIKETTPAPPVEAVPIPEAPAPESEQDAPAEAAIQGQSPAAEQQSASEIVQDAEENAETQKDVPHQSIEVNSTLNHQGEHANIP